MAKSKPTIPPSSIAISGKHLPLAAIAAAVNQAMKNPEAIRLIGANDRSNVSAQTTGNLAIDLATGVGGLALGRVTEIFGPESSGKTTFCLAVIAEVQRRGGNAAFIDVEHALDPKFAKVVGVDVDSLLIAQPDSGEDALRVAETLLKLGNEVDVIVVDSVAALVPKSELDGEIGDASMGAQARLMSQAMRKLTALVSRTNCVVIFTNQIREKIGVMFGNPETTPGGRALRFFASMRIDIRRKDQIKTPDGRVVGNRTKIKIVKNKVAPPFTEVEFDIMYDEGISKMGSLLDLGLEHKILEKKGAWITYDGALIGQGRDAAKAALKEKPELAEQIRSKVLKIVHVPTVAEPVALDESILKAISDAETDGVGSTVPGQQDPAAVLG